MTTARPVAAVLAVIVGTGCAAVDPAVVPGDATLATATIAPPEGRGSATMGEGSTAPSTQGLDEALAGVAAAFRARDPDAVADWLDDPDGTFGRRWQARAENLREVPLATYTLERDTTYPDLTLPRVRDHYTDPVVVTAVEERHALEGFDPRGPVVETLYLTAVRRPEGWRFAGDTDAETLGLISADHLWDHGPVVTTREGGVLALHHPDAPAVTTVVGEAAAAIPVVQQRWPGTWPARLAMIVPRDQDELEDLLHVSFDLSNFVAFATATVDGELGAYELTGSRILLNPDRLLGRDAQTRELILVHEMTHVATRPAAGPFVPSWLDEGVAQVLGERRSTTGTRLVDAVLARGDATLPTDGQFVVGGRDRIFLSYQLAWSFVGYLAQRYGAAQVAAFYTAVGAGAVGRPGTTSWHVDRAAREVFGRPLDELVEAWSGSG